MKKDPCNWDEKCKKKVQKERPKTQSESLLIPILKDETRIDLALSARLLKAQFKILHSRVFSASENFNISKNKCVFYKHRFKLAEDRKNVISRKIFWQPEAQSVKIQVYED